MNQPSVSIIVPIYNVEPYVEDCIRSVMRQTYTGPMECIIVDDCGTDNSMAVLERLISEYNCPIAFKVLHHEHNRGLSAARNTGMDAATGDYIFFLDSDDWLSEDCIEKLVSPIITEPAIEIVQGNIKRIPNDKPNEFPLNIVIKHAFSNSEARSTFFQNNQFPAYVWNKLICRSLIIKSGIKFREGLLWEDNLWHFSLLKKVENVFFVSGITYYYRGRPNSIMNGTDDNVIFLHFVTIFREILTNLTPGHEREELLFYAKKLSLYYPCHPRVFKNVYRLFWQRACSFRCYSCIRILIMTYIRSSKTFRNLVEIYRKVVCS